ncbi:MAG: 16S rRNA (cytosine(967)-C(5))-methyltransferase RsmB [Eubacteriales bacterium]
MNVRDLVYRSLIAIEKEGKYSNLELSSVIGEKGLEGKDRSLFTAMLYGVVERKITLDYFIEHYTKKAVQRLDLSVVTLLRMGIYQIVYLEKIPDSAAVNETVKLGQRYASRAKGFLNGVLRSVCRDKESLPYPDREKNPIEWLSVYYGVQKWICESFCHDYPTQAEGILASLSETPTVTLRVNTLKTDRQTLLSEYPDLLAPCDWSPYALRMTEAFPLSEFAPLHDGRCYVQDEASQIAGLVLNPCTGDLIMDVCAAPGGKSFFAAISTGDTGKLISMDLHESKLSLIKSGAERLGIRNIEVISNDSTIALPDYIGKADRVICDVPCSGLGVLAKKSDIRNKIQKTLDKLTSIQYNILVSSSRYLKSGGSLVYSTCTLRKAENEQIVEHFLQENPDFESVPFSVGSLSSPDGMLTLLPQIHHTDGFFVAKIRKK